MSMRDNLIAAKALIDKPEKWGKLNVPNNCKPCALQAVAIVSGFDGRFYDMPEYDSLSSALPPGTRIVGLYNDAPSTTHADIMSLFQRAIEAAGDK